MAFWASSQPFVGFWAFSRASQKPTKGTKLRGTRKGWKRSRSLEKAGKRRRSPTKGWEESQKPTKGLEEARGSRKGPEAQKRSTKGPERPGKRPRSPQKAPKRCLSSQSFRASGPLPGPFPGFLVWAPFLGPGLLLGFWVFSRLPSLFWASVSKPLLGLV